MSKILNVLVAWLAMSVAFTQFWGVLLRSRYYGPEDYDEDREQV